MTTTRTLPNSFAMLLGLALLLGGIVLFANPPKAYACDPYDECWYDSGGGIIQVGGCGGYEDCYWGYMEGYYGYSESTYGPIYGESAYEPIYSESTYSPIYGESAYGPGPYSESTYGPGPYSESAYGPGPYSESDYGGGYGESDYYGESSYGGGGSPAATVSLTATPLSVAAGGTSRLTWTSSNASTCTGTGFNTGGATSNGVGVVVGPLTAPGPWPYQISCTGSGGSGNDSKTVTINSGVLYMLGTPSRVNSGAATNIAWSASGLPASTVCTLTRNGSAWSAASPASRTANSSGVIATSSTNVSDTITNQTIYKLTCNGVVYQAIVNVNGQVQEF